MNNKFLQMTFVLAAFMLGWYASSQWSNVSDKKTFPPTAFEDKTLVERNGRNSKMIETLPKKSLLTGRVAELENAEIQNRAADIDNTSIYQQFTGLLQLKHYQDAVALYNEITAANENHSEKLKAILLSHLKNLLQTRRSEDFVNLTDAYLSDHYADIDVLLLLAEFNRISGYLTEATRVFQLAFTYVYDDTEKYQVTERFDRFIRATDTYLSEQNLWLDLQYFYETLTQADLITPQYQLRQAEVYINNQDFSSAKELLKALIEQGQWRTKAEPLLASIETEATDIDEKNAWAEIIPLQRRGNHYRVQLGVGNADSVQLLIDTGASVTSIARTGFEKLSRNITFQPLGSRMFNTANGVTKAKVFKAPELRLGRFTLKNVELAVLDFDPGQGLDGLLGMNILRYFRFEINQDEPALYLQERE